MESAGHKRGKKITNIGTTVHFKAQLQQKSNNQVLCRHIKKERNLGEQGKRDKLVQKKKLDKNIEEWSMNRAASSSKNLPPKVNHFCHLLPYKTKSDNKKNTNPHPPKYPTNAKTIHSALCQKLSSPPPPLQQPPLPPLTQKMTKDHRAPQLKGQKRSSHLRNTNLKKHH